MAKLIFEFQEKKLSNDSSAMVIKIIGPMDATNVKQLEDTLTSIFNQGIKNIILDMTVIRNINSVAMGLLVNLTDKFRNNGGDIKLAEVAEKVVAIFDMLGLWSLFTMYETVDDALLSYSV